MRNGWCGLFRVVRAGDQLPGPHPSRECYSQATAVTLQMFFW